MVDDAEARGFLCEASADGMRPQASWAQTLFQFRPRDGQTGAILVLLWTREDDRWHVQSFDIADP